ncbi:VOC family protein [Dickeya sp. Secpp 1600]|uniref:VOC family protein n=1 Tax=Dickeya sp. Secpp 1600 TaxID=2037915 RepID=UPI000D32499C|nr:VOC family protein [Dickeya sp. Secpp 1600]
MRLFLDHLVLNAHYDTDGAAALFRQLGFTLTPKGHHSLGSVNHLVLLGDSYLELLGLPAEQTSPRQELLAGPRGLDGVVFRSRDIAASAAALQAAGLATQPVRHFSRPVTLNGESHPARFSTVHLAAERFTEGRVYFCQHHTPELVWRDEWRRHANGVTHLSRLVGVAAAPDGATQRFQALGELDAAFALEFVTATAFGERYARLLPPGGGRTSQFAVLRLHGGDRPAIARQAEQLSLPCHVEPQRLLVALPAFNTLLEFVD